MKTRSLSTWSRRARGGLTALGLALGAACGGPSPEPMTLRFTSALDARVRTVQVRLFAGDKSCGVIEVSGPGIRGSYERTITADGSGQATSASIDTVYPDLYTVVVWAFDVGGVPVQFGCADAPVQIENGVRADVTIALTDYAGP